MLRWNINSRKNFNLAKYVRKLIDKRAIVETAGLGERSPNLGDTSSS